LTTKLLEENRRKGKKIILEKLQNQLENEINEMNQIDPSDDKSKKKAQDVLLELLENSDFIDTLQEDGDDEFLLDADDLEEIVDDLVENDETISNFIIC
jgi:hypothetical protein